MVRPERGAGIFNEGGWQLVHRFLQSFGAVFGRIVNTERATHSPSIYCSGSYEICSVG